MDKGETIVAEYLCGRGLRAELFTKEEKRLGKTPDFKVYDGDDLAFYCEVKTVEKDMWLDRQLDDAPPGTLVGGTRNDPAYNRIASDIYTASKQFDAVNLELHTPNVMAFVCFDEDCDERELIAVVKGNLELESGRLVPMFSKFSHGRIRERKHRIHMYAWFAGEHLSYRLFTDANMELVSRLRAYFEVDLLAEMPVIRGTF